MQTIFLNWICCSFNGRSTLYVIHYFIVGSWVLPLDFFLQLWFLNLTIWNSSICSLISIDRTSDKIVALLKKVTRWRYYSEFLKSKTKTNTSPLRMRSQGCPGCQNFWNFVLKTNLLVSSAKIQLKLIKLSKYGQKQRFFR